MSALTHSFHGLLSYQRGLELQERTHALVLADPGGMGHVLGLTHPPTYTLGRHADRLNLFASSDLPVVVTDRGGDVTYHGPEQLVVYPIVHLARAGLGVKDFVAVLEGAMLDCLASFGLAGSTRAGVPGVFVADEKLGFVGIRVKEGVAMHGLSLNLGGDLRAFSDIHPCGFPGLRVTSIQALTGVRPSHEEAFGALFSAMNRVLQTRVG